MEQEEAMRIREERMKDLLQVPGVDGEMVEWDGVRRRVTWGGSSGDGPRRRNTLSSPHPPLGMSRMPDLEEGVEGGAPVEPTLGGRRRSMSVDEAMRRQIYDLEATGAEEPHPQSFVGRVRSLFVPRQRSKASLRDEADVVVAVTSPHRDLPDHSQPAHPYTDRPPPLPLMEFSGTYPDHHGTKSTPQLSITPSEDFQARDFATGSPSPPPPPKLVKRTTSGGSQYTAIPVQAPKTAPPHTSSPAPRPPATPTTPRSTYSTESGLRPDTADTHAARRQFSFQNVFARHSRSHSRDSHGEGSSDVPQSHSGSHLPHSHLPARLQGLRGKSLGAQGGPVRTEEEMLGLVKGDSRSSTMAYEKDVDTVRYVESDSEEERERERERERARIKEWDSGQGRGKF